MWGSTDRDSISGPGGRRYVLSNRLQLVTLGGQRTARGQLLGGGRGESTREIRRILMRKVDGDRALSSSYFAEIYLAYFRLSLV